MVAANEDEKKPVRPLTLHELKAGLPGLGNGSAQVNTAQLRNFTARQESAVAAKQATEATVANLPPPASGVGLARPAGTYDELKAAPTKEAREAARAAYIQGRDGVAPTDKESDGNGGKPTGRPNGRGGGGRER